LSDVFALARARLPVADRNAPLRQRFAVVGRAREHDRGRLAAALRHRGAAAPVVAREQILDAKGKPRIVAGCGAVAIANQLVERSGESVSHITHIRL